MTDQVPSLSSIIASLEHLYQFADERGLQDVAESIGAALIAAEDFAVPEFEKGFVSVVRGSETMGTSPRYGAQSFDDFGLIGSFGEFGKRGLPS